MKFPLASFIIAILFWLIFLVTFSYRIFSPALDNTDYITIDADIIAAEEKESNKPQSLENKGDKPFEEKKQLSTTVDNGKNDAVAIVNYRPLPEIPPELRREAFNSHAVARFHVKSDGSFTVELIKLCDNPRLNYLLLKSLKKWQFAPAKRGGVAVDSVQDIKVNFTVE